MSTLDIPTQNALSVSWQQVPGVEKMERAEIEQTYRALLTEKEALNEEMQEVGA